MKKGTKIILGTLALALIGGVVYWKREAIFGKKETDEGKAIEGGVVTPTTDADGNLTCPDGYQLLTVKGKSTCGKLKINF